MRKQLTSFTKLIKALLFCYILSGNALAQNPAHPDTTFGMGGFSGAPYVVQIQHDGKVVVGGLFESFKNVRQNNIARLNTDGTLDKTFATGLGANNRIMGIAIQPDGRIILVGWFSSFNGVTCRNLVRLNADGTHDLSFTTGTGTNSSINAVLLQPDGKILIGGTFLTYNGIAIKKIARLNSDGTLDDSFMPSSTGADNAVKTISLQSNGKIIIGGTFLNYDGVSRVHIARLNNDGTLDNDFNPGTGFSYDVYSSAVQTDGRILVGGNFTMYNSTTVSSLVRLDMDGSLDGTFSPGAAITPSTIRTIQLQTDGKILVGGTTSRSGNSASFACRLLMDGTLDPAFQLELDQQNTFIESIAIRSDGKIFIAGSIASVNGRSNDNIALINPDGTADNSFNTDRRGADKRIMCIEDYKNGKLLIGGRFTRYNNVDISRVTLLNSDGTLDLSFNSGTGPNEDVLAIATQPDGKIIIGGKFTNYNGTVINRIARLNPDGSLDPGFNIGSGINNEVRSILVQPDGKIIITGFFFFYNGVSKQNICRLHSDGSLDASFNTGSGANGVINASKLTDDGKIIIAGSFTTYNGIIHNKIARLNPDGTLDLSFNTGASFGTTPIISDFCIQPDGKIIIAGTLVSFNGIPINGIARLNPNGTLDRSFNIGTGFNSSSSRVAMQDDGKIIVTGLFSTFNGISSIKIARLNPDGSRDTRFNVGTGISGDRVEAIRVLPDGGILLAGEIYFFNNMNYNYIVKLKGDPIYFNIIRGNIYTDVNSDCIHQPTEEKIQSVVVKAMPGEYYGGSDGNGKYQIRVDSGIATYTLSQQYNSINAKLLKNQCATTHSVVLKGASRDTASFDFADTIRYCSLLNISIQNTRMRRCFRGNTYVDYCNYGNRQVNNVQIKIEYPDYIIPIKSVPMWTSKIGSLLIYEIGTIDTENCGTIFLTDSVMCGDESIRGFTQCIKASISPTSDCTDSDPAWDQSSVNVTGGCEGQNAWFAIQNKGTGNMATIQNYRVYANDTLIYTSTFKLNSEEQFIVRYPAQGQTIRLEADQHSLHPGKSLPRATVEGCGTSISGTVRKGLVKTSVKDDLDEEIAVTCNSIVDSYDPNDKQAIPAGIGTFNQVVPGTELEYIIRFQNTGSDTAYTVRLVDTLDTSLDIASFTQGTGSHPYTLQVTGKGKAVLSFNFYNINLPSSSANYLASNGLVSFRITIPDSTALGTVIRNKAYIYFDYNSPIITNEIMHTVGITVAEDFNKGNSVQVGTVTTGIQYQQNVLTVSVFPIPAVDHVTFNMKGVTAKKYTLNCLNTLGMLIGNYEFTSEEFKVITTNYPKGIYFYTLKDNQGNSINGKFVIE